MLTAPVRADEADHTNRLTEVWLYAQLANNTYDPGRVNHFVLPCNVEVIRAVDNGEYEGVVGLAFTVFGIRADDGRFSEIVIAYRGTENWDDWSQGNLIRRQNAPAVRVHDEVRQEFPGVPISVTGDSLGGALAAQVSICRDVHRRLSINTSPRFSYRFCGGEERSTYSQEEKQRRYTLFVNRGEALQFVRWVFRSERVQTYVSARCERGSYSGLRHSIEFSSRCVTLSAARSGSAGACESILRNRELYAHVVPPECGGSPAEPV